MSSFFFFNDTATTEIYTLSLHDALPIYLQGEVIGINTAIISRSGGSQGIWFAIPSNQVRDRKSTRLNSSHLVISYAVFCLKKKSPAVVYLSPHSHGGTAASPPRQTTSYY